MATAYVILTDGFEETEAVVVVDLLRRAGIHTVTVSLGGQTVTGSHKMRLEADALFGDLSDGDVLVLPGGPGTSAYIRHEGLAAAVRAYAQSSKWLAAICAAPTALYDMGVMAGKVFTCYPGMGDGLAGVTVTDDDVAVDGKLITAKGPGAAIAFGAMIVERLLGAGAAEAVCGRFCYPGRSSAPFLSGAE